MFTLYAADTPDVREKNEQYGDDSDHRGADIKVRGKNWDKMEPHLDDAMAWNALSDDERVKAARPGTGTGEPEPGTPSPSPGPTPTPPGVH
ncbi:hypothetical protein [Streptomyces mirabilis]|uniref:hypothetical protein n=1 Tax=Streptomyces mirabilis TaxID=68239 RepID=UPI000765E435